MKHTTKHKAAGFFTTALAVVCVVGAGVAWASDSGSGQVRLRTQLSGGAIGGKTPHGQADARSEVSRNRNRLQVEIEDVNLPDGTSLEIDLNKAKVGTITVKNGFGELELESEHGDVVPAVQAGDVITVVGAKGTVLAGAF